jgi:Sulfotransferase domain
MTNMDEKILSFLSEEEKAMKRTRFFLVGRGKSGTTWTAKVFRAHPDCAFVGERRLFENTDGNRRLLEPFLSAEQFSEWRDYSSYGILHNEDLDVRFELSRLVSDYLLLKSLSLDQKQLRRETHIGEKIAVTRLDDTITMLENLVKIYPTAKIVHIVRDGRDVAVSQLFHIYRNAKLSGSVPEELAELIKSMEDGQGITSQFSQKYYTDSANNWTVISAKIHELGNSIYGEKFMTLRYEDLARNFNKTVRTMFDFLNLPSSDKTISEIADQTTFEKISGRKNGQQDAASFYRKGVAGDWKNSMASKDQEIFDLIAGNTLRHFGY